jgi:hypothetical protein
MVTVEIHVGKQDRAIVMISKLDEISLQPVNILCFKWGKRYPANFVNILFNSVRRHLSRPFLFHCCTEDAEGLDPEIMIIPFPENPGLKRGWPDIFVKLLVFKDGFGGLSGPTLFLDLDVAILADIDVFFEYQPGDFCIIHDWSSWQRRLLRTRPRIGNSSIFRFEAGASNYIYECFIQHLDVVEDLSRFNTEQAFMTYAVGEQIHFWPEEWAVSFKEFCKPTFPLNHFIAPKPPENCRILVFHGKPDPDEAISGFLGRRPHHRILPAPWLEDYWK